MYNRQGEEYILLMNFCISLNQHLKKSGVSWKAASEASEDSYLIYIEELSWKFNYSYSTLQSEFNLANFKNLQNFVKLLENLPRGKRLNNLTIRGFQESNIHISDVSEPDFPYITGEFILRNCIGCNRLFGTLNKNQRYCAPFCKKEAINRKRKIPKVSHTCPICGDMFEGTTRKLTCGKSSCKKRDYRARRNNDNNL